MEDRALKIVAYVALVLLALSGLVAAPVMYLQHQENAALRQQHAAVVADRQRIVTQANQIIAQLQAQIQPTPPAGESR